MIKRKPVIIDTDPGVDDALAILLALSADNLDVKAITTVAGNQTIDKTTMNALKIVDFLGVDTKVAKGAFKPLLKKLETADDFHGITGLGNAVLPETNRKAYAKNAVETIYETANSVDGKLQIIALGPLTNIAVLLTVHPDVKDKIENLTLMGGACYGGNSTPSAEFNIFTDPDGARIVFESGIPITMVGLDATHKVMLYENEIKDIADIKGKVSKFTNELLSFTLDACKRCRYEGAILHDPLAVAAVIDPSIIGTRKCHVDVETKAEFTIGKTVVDVNNVKNMPLNCEVAFEADRERVLKLLKEMVIKYGI